VDERDGFIGIDTPDAPIYRIFPLWYFEETLRLRQLVLVPPQWWHDPFEILASQTMMEDEAYSQESLEPYLQHVFAQCWSMTEESDTLLRAYSRVSKDPHFNRNICPREEGVRVKTSPRKLLSALQKWAAATTMPGVSCFIGSVKYMAREQVQQTLTNWIYRHGPHAVGRGRLRAELLLLKRLAFSHEAEVRIICVASRDVPEESFPRIPIDPTELFDEVTFDPRLEPFEREERKAATKSLGYNGRFNDSELYHGTELIVKLPVRFPEWLKPEEGLSS
jgi:hypothetical protein